VIGRNADVQHLLGASRHRFSVDVGVHPSRFIPCRTIEEGKAQ